jgi:hypothetical protein
MKGRFIVIISVKGEHLGHYCLSAKTIERLKAVYGSLLGLWVEKQVIDIKVMLYASVKADIDERLKYPV